MQSKKNQLGFHAVQRRPEGLLLVARRRRVFFWRVRIWLWILLEVTLSVHHQLNGFDMDLRMYPCSLCALWQRVLKALTSIMASFSTCVHDGFASKL